MALYNTLEEANLALKEVNSKEDIINILKDINIDSEGTKTVLYSSMDDATISKLKNDSSVRLIDKTVAADFLDYKKNLRLRATLEEVFGKGNPDFDFDIEVENRNSALNKFLFSAGEGNAWDTVSKRFAEATKGEVITMIGEKASPDRIFFQAELKALKENPDITLINKISKKGFFSVVDAIKSDTDKLDTIKSQYNHLVVIGKGNITKAVNLTAIEVRTYDVIDGFKDTIKNITKTKTREYGKYSDNVELVA